MKILIIGSGGREHALSLAYSRSDRVSHVYVAPGNGLIGYRDAKITACPEVSSDDFSSILQLVRTLKIDLVDVAPDDLLARGFVDKLTKEKIPAFGPTQQASEIEWNKEWSRNFMVKYGLPRPAFHSFSDVRKANAYVKRLPEQVLFVKASGLALGKGVIKAEGRDEALAAIAAMQEFGSAGKTFLIEEAMQGEEFSLFAVCDGKDFIITKAAQDHKTVFNADTGPNTGGMGCVTPTGAVSEKLLGVIGKTILTPFLEGMRNEGRTYSGILYLGGMITKSGVKVVEFNARWGDPEAEVILPGIQTDYLTIVEAVIQKQLGKVKIAFDKKVRVSIAGCARGYPTDYSSVKGKEIFGINEVFNKKDISVYGAGISRTGNRFFANGGRLFHIVAEGKDFSEARRRGYEAISVLHVAGNNLHYRTDIGWRELERFYR